MFSGRVSPSCSIRGITIFTSQRRPEVLEQIADDFVIDPEEIETLIDLLAHRPQLRQRISESEFGVGNPLHKLREGPLHRVKTWIGGTCHHPSRRRRDAP